MLCTPRATVRQIPTPPHQAAVVSAQQTGPQGGRLIISKPRYLDKPRTPQPGLVRRIEETWVSCWWIGIWGRGCSELSPQRILPRIEQYNNNADTRTVKALLPISLSIYFKQRARPLSRAHTHASPLLLPYHHVMQCNIMSMTKRVHISITTI